MSEGETILGLDTATADAAVAVTAGGELLVERRSGEGPGGRPHHAARLLAEIEAAVTEAGGWDRVDVIAVGIGPGTFTGLRVGIATARALAQARSLPIAAVSSLEALGRGIGERIPGRPRLPLIDARRSEVFVALFDAGGRELWTPAVAPPEELGERVAALSETPVAAGDGSLRFREQLESAGVEVLPGVDPAHRLAARHICALATTAGRGGPTDIRPAYLRRPDAEVWREQRDRERGPD